MVVSYDGASEGLSIQADLNRANPSDRFSVFVDGASHFVASVILIYDNPSSVHWGATGIKLSGIYLEVTEFSLIFTKLNIKKLSIFLIPSWVNSCL